MRYQLSKRPLRARDHTPTVIWAQRVISRLRPALRSSMKSRAARCASCAACSRRLVGELNPSHPRDSRAATPVASRGRVLGWLAGLEPAFSGFTDRRLVRFVFSHQESFGAAGIEPATSCFQGRRATAALHPATFLYQQRMTGPLRCHCATEAGTACCPIELQCGPRESNPAGLQGD